MVGRQQHRRLAAAVCLAVLAIGCSPAVAAPPIAESSPPAATEMVLLSPPDAQRPVVVRASFQLLTISQIEDEAEKVAFSGVLTLVWNDPRQAFDPAEAGVRVRVFSGAYQFNELSPSWYPQVTLANAAGQYDSRAVLLSVQADGTSTLHEEIEATAKVDINMRRFPFDRQRLEGVFRVFGYDSSHVVLESDPGAASTDELLISLPQWTLKSAKSSIQTISATQPGATGDASALVVEMDVERQPLFMLRLVVFPLCLIVILSWSVFWLDRSSVGDRMSVSFVGILTAVAYQITLVGIVPNVSYFTLMNGFLNLSFLLMCATVVINLYVGAADRRGHERGDRIDRNCRWIFPLIYFGLNAIALAVALLFF